MKTPDISTIHETVLHGDMRFHLMVHEFASDPSRSERVTSHWHEEYELLFLTKGNGTAHVNGRALPISAGDILFFNSGEVHSISAPPGVPPDLSPWSSVWISSAATETTTSSRNTSTGKPPASCFFRRSFTRKAQGQNRSARV